MADYDLHRLGPQEFEHLAQALVAEKLGPAVRIYGSGRDGGREATLDGSVVLPGGQGWTGYTVVQVKFRSRPSSVGENTSWLRNEVHKECNAWVGKVREKERKPRNLLFITNVALSAVPGHGVDAIHGAVEEFSDRLPLAQYAVWHYEHVCRLLDGSPGIRRAFAGLITPGDVLAELHRILIGDVVDLGEVLRSHAAKELLAEQWVRLGQSGSRSNEKLPIGRVAVDLTAECARDSEDPRRVPVVRHLLELGDAVHRPSVRSGHAAHTVLVGGAGQGKTTLGQLLCQAYRVALLQDAHSFGPEVSATIDTLRGHLSAIHVPVPASKRWPLRVDLSRYADRLAGDEDTSILRFIADQVTQRGTSTVTPSKLHSWLGAWPWLLVLDGFDEVVAPHVRDAMVQRISDLLIDAASVDADLMLVATTRPRGYSGEFTADQYEHLVLTDLDSTDAIAYARRLADVRHVDDPDMHRNVLDRIFEAADEELTARLMRTPLQVTIMSLLLEGRARVPQHRHGLFEAYYETIYNRETDKNTSTARLLDEHRQTVDFVHEQVGLILQVAAEADGQAEPAVSRDELRALAIRRLTEHEYSPTEAATLADNVALAATDRLVLLVPKNDGDVGFEVRSLQEYMAARALVKGGDADIIAKLRHLAPASHWRNTWLLAAGRVAAHRDHLVENLLSVLSEIDVHDYLMMQLAPGAELAADLLDDGFAATSPRIGRLLLRHAVEVLRRPIEPATFQTADILQRVSVGRADGATAVIADVARQALAADPPQRVTAAVVLHRWTRLTGSLATLGRQRVPTLDQALGPDHAAALRMHFLGSTSAQPDPPTTPRGTLGDYFAECASLDGESASLDGEDLAALERLRIALRVVPVEAVADEAGEPTVAVVRHLRTPDQLLLDAALSRPVVADRVANALRLGGSDWAVGSALTTIARQWLQRRPVGAVVLNPVRSTVQHER